MRKVGVCGRFNGLHPGHIEYIERASKEGDKLVVFLLNDEYNEGTGDYLIPQEDRKKLIETLKYVDLVEIIREPEKMVKKDIDVIVAGADWCDEHSDEFDKIKQQMSVVDPQQEKKYSNSDR